MNETSQRPLRNAWVSLALLAAAAGSVNAHAYSVPIPSADLGDARPGAVVKVAYGAQGAASRAIYAAPAAVTSESRPGAAPASGGVGEVELWQLGLAVLGLAGIRMWRAGKKSLPLLG